MINNNEFIKQSLDLHLFFARIMKEHSLFLEAGFMEKDEDFKKKAYDFQKEFGDVLHKVLDLSNGRVSKEVLSSGEIITNNTLKAEKATSGASGLHIDESITTKELNLTSLEGHYDHHMEMSVHHLNEQVITLVDHLIKFKTEILNKVLECRMFTVNYPLLIEHIIREAKLYKESIQKLQRKETVNLFEQEIFWNRQMKEHAEFIRGLLDPSEEELILTADKFADEYKTIMMKHIQNPELLTDISLQETISFKQFKEVGNDGILNCKIKSIIIPLLADHVLREANHFIRVMKENKKDHRFYYH